MSGEGDREMWTWGSLILPWGLGTGRLGSRCIVLCGDRVPEESEDPKGTWVRKVTR